MPAPVGQLVSQDDSPASKRAFELAYEYEGKYGACSQCTILAIMDGLGKRNPDVFKASFGFAGGIGGLSKICGALSSGVLAISRRCGRDLDRLTTQSEEERRGCMEKVRSLYDRSFREYGTGECEAILDPWDKQEFQESFRLGGT